MMPSRTPQSIPELWYALDKRLALIEETQAVGVGVVNHGRRPTLHSPIAI